ncbi:S-adenosylmethionine decarboxylase related protein [Pseudalkalibacillus decolorationis]|uniref:S-adenosylmethionine decarboxylase related protein n=1 Tax=Pseudalkalibacillus decolorationis TaxID=163879 RepID=UPI002147A01D|nr:S-adenosylmethionine decarboxylase related protein [Pseudalkalibacillus decolorationis]
MNKRFLSITILGSAGGVAKSFLSILNKTILDKKDPLHSFMSGCQIHLIDRTQKSETYYNRLFPNLADKVSLHEFDLQDILKFSNHLKSTNTSIVIDLSWADTIEMLECCDKLGVYYVNSALESTLVDENEELHKGFPLIERIKHFESKKDNLSNTKAIIGSGMNPGVVQWMALELMKKDKAELPLACYVVEQDTSFYLEKSIPKENVVYTSWSPECFLDEAIMSYPMFMRQRIPLFLYNQPYEFEFNVTLGEKKFDGCLMPHEEIYTLGKLYDMETGFIYKVNDHTTKLIRNNLSNVDDIWDFDMKVLDPYDAPLTGEDLVGVLLVYQTKELYMYNVMSNEIIFNEFRTNATYFQVACGIYAAACTLLLDQIPKGIYYVDELLLNFSNKYGDYLKHYMKDFVVGENQKTDGLLLDRIKKI